MDNKKSLLIFLIIVTSLSVIILYNPLSGYLEKKERQRIILSSLYFTYPNINDYAFQAIKFKMSSKVFLEIYKIFPDNRFELLAQFDTGTSKDGHFLVGSNATNLALTDIDNDEINEIISPGFDDNLSAKLNVYKFDETKKTFYLDGPDQL